MANIIDNNDPTPVSTSASGYYTYGHKAKRPCFVVRAKDHIIWEIFSYHYNWEVEKATVKVKLRQHPNGAELPYYHISNLGQIEGDVSELRLMPIDCKAHKALQKHGELLLFTGGKGYLTVPFNVSEEVSDGLFEFIR